MLLLLFEAPVEDSLLIFPNEFVDSRAEAGVRQLHTIVVDRRTFIDRELLLSQRINRMALSNVLLQHLVRDWCVIRSLLLLLNATANT